MSTRKHKLLIAFHRSGCYTYFEVNKMENGKNIKAARIYRGLTQQKLGELCGLATGTIQQYELNKRNPKIEQVAKIADALNLAYNISGHGAISFYDFVDTTNPDSKAVDFNNQQLSSAPATKEKKEAMQKEMQEIIRNGISMDLTAKELSIVNKMKELNDAGQDKAVEQVEMLAKIPEYRKDAE